ncbi:MAG: chromosomal replication initiator protein DnaA [Defluviitaleaceae bacterium]|nr:chromosomal replication initiator protein DnaA [Defluviitaleaceae bacterium]
MKSQDSNLIELWQRTLPILQNSMTPVVYEAHIAPIQPFSYENGILTLKTESNFFKHEIIIRYLPEITRSLRSVANFEIADVMIVSPDDFDGGNMVKEHKRSQYYEKTNLRQKYIFGTFVKGKCNELAYAAALAVADTPGVNTYNPLFLYGGVGLGKTHLIHAIGNQILEHDPETKVMYVSSETFTNEFIRSIRENTTQAFKNKYRECDVLLVDDVQFLMGKVETQEELFHTFNDLHSANKQIILTSDLPPKDLTGLETRLTSRFAAGLIADITMPDYETRTAILEKKLAVERMEIPKEVKEFITNNIVSNIRDLEGALNKVMAYAKLTNKTINLELAETALKDQLVGRVKPEITIPYIQKIVTKHFKVTIEDICGRKRTQAIVLPRQIAMFLSRKLLDVSLPDVGRNFGDRDHSTVIHSCEKIQGEMDMDEKLRLLVDELETRIKGE